MMYSLKIAEETVELDISTSDNKENTLITIGGEDFTISYQVVSHNHIHLIVNGKAVEAYVAQGENGKFISINGRYYLVQDTEKMTTRRLSSGIFENLPSEVTPPIPAVVVRILVEEGDRVKGGPASIRGPAQPLGQDGTQT